MPATRNWLGSNGSIPDEVNKVFVGCVSTHPTNAGTGERK